MPIIVSKLYLFQVQKKLFLGDSMELNDSLFGIAPESLEAVNVSLRKRIGSYGRFSNDDIHKT